MASRVSSTRCSDPPDDAVYPSLKIRYSTRNTEASRSGNSLPVASPNLPPVALIRCFARLIRCPTVASGTRKARAISAVVSPPTARRVNATWDGGGSRFLPSSARRFVAPQFDPPPGRDGDQPAGRIAGHPVAGPLHRSGEQRLLHRVLRGLEVPRTAQQRGDHDGRELTQAPFDVDHRARTTRHQPGNRTAGPGRHISMPLRSITGRTSTYPPGVSGIRAAICRARSMLSHC